jgi:phosphate-induced protein 1
MMKTTASLLGGLFYAGAALAQDPVIEQLPVSKSALSTDDQQYIASEMRTDSLSAPTGTPSLNITTPSGAVAHILPEATRLLQMRRTAPAADTGPLLYHTNGFIVQHPHIYQIFWAPQNLQTGAATGYSPKYVNVNVALAAYYNGHGIATNNTQYFEVINGQVGYVQNDGFLVSAVVDRDPYPASGCNDPLTPGNCLSDAQVQQEILKVIQSQNWQVGINSIFMVYTSSGEGSCLAANSQPTDCAAPGGYCAYHSFIPPKSNNINEVVLYANIPYPPPGCFGKGKSPNNDVDADTAATAASHELTEVITNPVANGWYTAQGNEIGDLCAGFYDVNTYANGLANQSWNGSTFELQTEFDNHSAQCVQTGPLYVELAATQ